MIPVDTLLLILVVTAMVVVGFELTLHDLRRVAHYPTHVLVSVAGQVLALPAIGAAIIVTLDPPPLVAGGLVLVSVAPQATSANLVNLIAKADVALSVTVTTVSNLAALFMTPLAARVAFDGVLQRPLGFDLPYPLVMRQITLGMLLPIALGMALRHRFPQFAERHRNRLRNVTLAALVVMLALMVLDQGEAMVRELRPITLAATLFTVSAAGVGLAIAMALRWPRDESVSTAVGFSLRSLSVATLIAISVLGSTTFLAFAAPFFVIQALLMVPVTVIARRVSAKP